MRRQSNTLQSEFLQRKLAAMSERATAMEEKVDRDVAEKTKALEVCPLLSARTQLIRHSSARRDNKTDLQQTFSL